MTEFVTTRKLNHYRNLLSLLYAESDEILLEQIVAQSPIYIQEEYTYDSWNGGQCGHALILYLEESFYRKIDFEEKERIEEKLVKDFNKILPPINNEFIAKVIIDLFNPEHEECQVAIKPNSVISINGDNTSLWKAGYIRLFISHRDANKVEVSELAEELLPYGISCFVAHSDIEPTEEWRNEIEKALRSMDIFLAYITDDFSGGGWTNQEVGFAIARRTPIIPLKMSSKDPYGFMSIYQGLPRKDSNLDAAADSIFKLISTKFDQKNIVKKATISAFINSKNYFESMEIFKRLQEIKKITDNDLDQIVNGFNNNDQLYNCAGINARNQFFKFLQKQSSNSYEKSDNKIQRKADCDMPF